MLAVLEERNFPINNLLLLSSSRSAGKEIMFGGEKHLVVDAAKCDFANIDILFGAVSSEMSRVYTPQAVAQGAVVIDNSSAYRLNADVPLIIPEINPDDVRWHKGIIANPNCTTTIVLIAVNRLHRHSRIERMIVATYQAVSGAGAEAVRELERQTVAYAANSTIVTEALNQQILFNLIPHIDSFTENGYTYEEMKLVHESRKILHSPDLQVSATCVRVPVLRSHSAAVIVSCADEITPAEAQEILRDAPGVELVDDIQKNLYPMPLNTSGQDLVQVGRIRKDLSSEGLCLWCCGDQLRKGAATNAVQIAELLLEQYERDGR